MLLLNTAYYTKVFAEECQELEKNAPTSNIMQLMMHPQAKR